MAMSPTEMLEHGIESRACSALSLIGAKRLL